MGELIENKQSKTTPTWEEEMYWECFRRMYFYQVLPHDFLDHLALPSKFAKNMANKLPNKVTLVGPGPGGLTWDVELSKTGTGGLDLVGDGWNDFAKAYKLEHDFLLAFKYKQNSTFKVLIFDQKSSCEKESCYFVKRCLPKPEGTTDGKRCVSETPSTEMMEDSDDGSDCVRSKKAKKGIAEQGHTSDEVPEDDHNYLDLNVSDQAIDDVNVEAIDWGGKENRPRSTMCVSNEAAAKDGGGPSNTPKSNDQSVKNPGDGNTPTRTVIELDEMEQIPAENREKEMLEKVIRSKQYQSCKPGVIRSRVRKQTIPKPWSKRAFKGSRRESTKDYISHKWPLSSKEKGDAFTRANEASSEGDFIVELPPSAVYRKFYLSIPSAWIQENMAKQTEDVILRVGEKIWVTSYRPRVNSFGEVRKSGGLANGWKEFALQNKLDVSDACLFKPASKNGDPTLTFDVQIFRVIDECTTDRKRCVRETASSEIMEDNDDGSDYVLSKKAKKGIAEQGYTSDEFSEDDHYDLDLNVSDKAIDDIIEEVDWTGRKNRPHATRCVSNEAATKDGGGPSNTPKSKAQSVKKPGDGNTSRTVNESDEMEQIPAENRKEMLEKVILSKPYQSCKPGVIRNRVRRQSTKDYISHKRPLSSKEKDDAFRRANEASTEGDFTVALPPSAVYRLFQLSLPSAWTQKNMAKQAQEVVLRVGEEKWVTLYRPRVNSVGHVLNSGALVKGWKNFVVQNNLDISDVCLFKPASKKGDPTLIFDVQIFRVTDETTPLICS